MPRPPAPHANSGVVRFEPRARLLKLIGGELVSDEVVAVTELVKNAYDADATRIVVRFENIKEAGGELVITDDGCGMDLDDVTRYWMQPGGTTKAGDGQRTSRGGRAVLGEKGIGRFAVDKLGAGLVLTSKKARQDTEVLCSFNWDDFETDGRMLSEVPCAWQVRAWKSLKKKGTVLRITDLRIAWTERLFRKLCLRLARLKSPFADAGDFRIIIESNDFPDYAGELSVDYLDRAPHSIAASFDGDQTITIKDRDGKRDLTWNGSGYLQCGPCEIRLFGFDLETNAVAALGPPREVRSWLKEWTGVSVYRDGFRLSPYGEPNDDWLRLDQRRVNNPTVCLSNNQIIGFIQIGRGTNPDLTDQTNREGMISNRPFEDLRRLALFVLQQLEARRLNVRHPISKKPDWALTSTIAQNAAADQLLDLAVGHTPKKASQMRALANRLRDNANKEEQRYLAFAAGYSELAAVGQIAENASTTMTEALERLESMLRDTLTPRDRKRAFKQIASLKSELRLLDPLEQVTSSRRRTIDLGEELQALPEYFDSLLTRSKVQMEVEVGDELLRAEINRENLLRLMHIFVTNSLQWLPARGQRIIKITAKSTADESQCNILVSDTGPGIPADFVPRVFDPMETGREGARGMGLTIARNIVQAAAGSIEVDQDGRRKLGAHIRVLLPRRRARVVRKR